jgi:transketolase
MRKSFTRVVSKILDEDSQACLLLGDIGVFGFQSSIERHPNRALNIGILEQSMVGVGAGMALAGMNPILHTIAPFLVERALEQIKVDFGYQGLSGNFVSVGASVDYSKLGATHHCPADVSIMSTIPRSKIFLPGTELEFEKQFLANYRENGIKYFRLAERQNSRSFHENSQVGSVVKSGNRCIVFAFGNILDRAIEACADLDVSLVYVNELNQNVSVDALSEIKRHSKYFAIEPFYQGSTLTFLQSILPKQKPIMQRNLGLAVSFITDYSGYDEILDHNGLSIEEMKNGIKEFISS